MKNLISSSIAKFSSVLNALQVKQFFAMALVGFILLTTNVDTGHSNKALGKQIKQQAHEIDSVRPKTTNEWKKEARETENSPGERIKNIGEESAKAVKEFGSLYPDTANRSANALPDKSASN